MNGVADAIVVVSAVRRVVQGAVGANGGGVRDTGGGQFFVGRGGVDEIGRRRFAGDGVGLSDLVDDDEGASQSDVCVVGLNHGVFDRVACRVVVDDGSVERYVAVKNGEGVRADRFDRQRVGSLADDR